jgi:CBS domain-containing protein
MTSIETTEITQEQTRKVIAISQYDRIIDAADLMHKNHIGCLVVAENNKDDTMVGIITERDILAWLTDASPATYFQQIHVIMTRDVISCHPGVSVSDAIEQMKQHHMRHMPMVEDGKAVGMISVRDLLEQRQFRSPSERI